MPTKDLHEALTRYYEFQMGKLPFREEFTDALRVTFSNDDLKIFFLLPFLGLITKEKYEKKAARLGVTPEQLQAVVKRLAPGGIVDTYEGAEGRVFARSWIISLLEFQVRLLEDSPMREVCAKVMNASIEGAAEKLPTRTPYYRVLPVETTLTGIGKDDEYPVGMVVPDPRQVLPLDKVSEMIKGIDVIAISDCYCRSAKQIMGDGCEHPLNTCFYFNELGLMKLETGYARRVTYDEAMDILRDCEKAGLVHNVSNCEGKIQTLCNCCPCSCGVLKGVVRGQTNTGAPSRYQAVLETARCKLHGACVEACPMDVFAIKDGKLEMAAEKCIGCGQCVKACPEGALRLELREKSPRMFKDNDALFRKINSEAMVGLVVRKVTGK